MEFIKDYENLYKINKQGEIYSCLYNKIMKHQINETGYLFVSLSKDRIKKKCFISRLLALQYIENPNNYPEVDHIDRNRLNNDLSNLRWVTRLENCQNKGNLLINLSNEELEERKIKLKEYKRIWAEKDRRLKGQQIKTEMTKTKEPNYNLIKNREYMARLTPEQKEAYLKRRRETRKPPTEEQKIKARERAKQQRERNKIKTIQHP